MYRRKFSLEQVQLVQYWWTKFDPSSLLVQMYPFNSITDDSMNSYLNQIRKYMNLHRLRVLV